MPLKDKMLRDTERQINLIEEDIETLQRELTRLENQRKIEIIETENIPLVGKTFRRESYSFLYDIFVTKYLKVISPIGNNEREISVLIFSDRPVSKFNPNGILNICGEFSVYTPEVETILKTDLLGWDEITEEEWEKGLDSYCNKLKKLELKP